MQIKKPALLFRDLMLNFDFIPTYLQTTIFDDETDVFNFSHVKHFINETMADGNLSKFQIPKKSYQDIETIMNKFAQVKVIGEQVYFKYSTNKKMCESFKKIEYSYQRNSYSANSRKRLPAQQSYIKSS